MEYIILKGPINVCGLQKQTPYFFDKSIQYYILSCFCNVVKQLLISEPTYSSITAMRHITIVCTHAYVMHIIT